MSANLDLVRSICVEWERGDYRRSDWAHPEIEFVLADGPDPGRWIGLAGMTAAWRNRLTSADDLRAIADEYRELDDGRVLVLFHNSGRGKGSGIKMTDVDPRGGASLFHVHNGRVIRLSIYVERDRALADLGLEA